MAIRKRPKRSHGGQPIDMGRLSAAVSRPGIDPRIWCAVGYVTAVELDAADGPLVDVVLRGSGEQITAAVGTLYAGNGWGIYAPIRVDDEVMVSLSNGELGELPVVTGRLWNRADAPPTAAVDHPDDLVVRVESGKAMRISVTGGGKLHLGSATADEPLVLGNVFKAWAGDFLDLYAAHVHPTAVGPSGPPVNAVSALALKAHPISDNAVLSDIALTSKLGD